jgi:hypothetical protein
MGIWSGEWNVPDDGVDRCRWLSCYRASNGAGVEFCEVHEKAPGAALLREALHATATLNGED